MKITEDYAKETIEEVAPLIEEISGLTRKLGKYTSKKISKRIFEEIKKDLELNFLEGYALSRIVLGVYDSKTNRYYYLENFPGNESSFKKVTSHETFHAFQYKNFPHLIKLRNELFGIEKNSLLNLIEGDAKFIESELSKKYYPNPKIHRNNLLKLLIPKKISNRYLKGEKILRKKFNGNRKDINELYTAPIKELIKIFGEIN